MFVNHIPLDVTEEELQEEFKQFGLVKSCTIVPGKGFGYVSFDTYWEAENAIIGLRDKTFWGSILSIDIYENKH